MYGRHPVLEALRAGRRLRRIRVARTAHGHSIREILAEAESREVPVEFVPPDRLGADAANHQGVVAEAEPFVYVPFRDLLAGVVAQAAAALLVAVDGLQDPQNLGTLIRTAAGADVHGLLLPEHRATGVTPAVLKASAGAAERLPIAQVSNLPTAIDSVKEQGIWVVGLAADGQSQPWEVDLRPPTMVVVGGEGKGLSRLVRERCDFTVRLPMPGPTESLNAAVAGSIALYEVLRQRASL